MVLRGVGGGTREGLRVRFRMSGVGFGAEEKAQMIVLALR